MESFESWLLHRVAEAAAVSADLLTEPQAGFEAARARPQEQRHTDALKVISVQFRMPIEKVEAGLATLEASPRMIREAILRRIALAWLAARKRAYRARQYRMFPLRRTDTAEVRRRATAFSESEVLQ